MEAKEILLNKQNFAVIGVTTCLLYTSDAADEL